MAPRNVPQSPRRVTEPKTKTVTKKIKEKPTLGRQIETVRMLVKAVATGRKDMQLICSEPGIGKTTIVQQELKKCDIKVECMAPGGIEAFVKVLYDHRDKPVVAFDDCDKLLRNEAIANIAKQAWGPSHLVIYQTVEARKNERRRDEDEDDFRFRHDPSIPPQRFRIKCRLLWLTNLDCTQEDVVKNEMSSHFRALISRGLDPFWVNSSNEEELFLYTLNLAPKMLSDQGMSLQKTLKTIGWFVENRNYLREICPRAVTHIARQFRSLDVEEAELILENSLLLPEKQRNLQEVIPPRFIKSNQWEPASLQGESEPMPVAATKKGFKKRTTKK